MNYGQFMVKLYHYNRTKLKDFYMGPSVKFVLPIIDAFPNKIMGVIFCVAKKDTTGGGGGPRVLYFLDAIFPVLVF